MNAYSVAEVKAKLSAILAAVESGEEVVITKRGKPIARIRRDPGAAADIDWARIDAFRAGLKGTKASVERARKQSRY